MELKEAILQRRSIRKFKPDPVPAEYITELLEAARLAPSGTNIQPWRFAIVKSREMRKKLAPYTLRFVVEAPVVFVCCADLSAFQQMPLRIQELAAAGAFAGTEFEQINIEEYLKNRPAMDEKALKAYASLNTALAIEHLILRATDLGLGSCWVMMFNGKGVKEVLGLGDHLHVVALVPVGYPDQQPAQRPRLALEDIILMEA